MPNLDFVLKPPLIAEDDFVAENGTFEEGENTENSPSPAPAQRRLSQYLYRLENRITNSTMDEIVEFDDDEFDDDEFDDESDGEEDVNQRLRTGSADKK